MKIRTLKQLQELINNKESTFSLLELKELLEELRLRLMRIQEDSIGLTREYEYLRGAIETLETTLSLLNRVYINKLPEVEPCPFCGSTEIDISLNHDCYSSWATIKCKKCNTKKEIGVDKSHSAFPNPTNDWKEKAINLWNERIK